MWIYLPDFVTNPLKHFAVATFLFRLAVRKKCQVIGGRKEEKLPGNE